LPAPKSEAADDEDNDDPLRRMTLVDFSAAEDWDQQPQASTAPQPPSPQAGNTPAPSEAEPEPEPEGFDLEGDDKFLHPAAALSPLEEEKDAAEEPVTASPAAALEAPPSTPFHATAAERDEDVDAETDDDSNDDEAAEEPGFVIRERTKERRRRVSRIVFGAGSALLLLGALAQGAYAFRDRLAASFPQTKPALQQLCQLAGCQVKLPTQIDMVSIESHELQSIAADKNVFALTLLLRNRSTVTQAWPDIELTLNDGDEKPLVRRVLTPTEYLASPAEVARGFSPQSEQAVKVSFELLQAKASGYRVYLFYP
jgi:hypothetical protein